MKVFLDTNILIDFLSDRCLFSKLAKEVLMVLEKNENLYFYSSTHSYATTLLVLKKVTPELALREKLLKLSDLVTVLV